MSVGAVNKQTGDRIPTAGMPAIDDALDLTSVNPVQNAIVAAALANKQDKTDNNLQTADKTIPGAINELKSGLTTLDTEVNGDATVYPYADVVTIEDAIPSNLADCSVKIEPVQDLHGYDKPWVGGAGKNKLPLTVDGIKAANTEGTWNGNVYTINNMTFTVLVDSDNNVVGLSLNGTNNGISYLVLDSNFDSTAHAGELVNGLDGQVQGLIFRVSSQSDFVSVQDIVNNNIAIEDNGSNKRFSLRAEAWKTFSNVLIYPMIRLATETDATFAPYTNICPISGHTEVDVQRDGKNLFDASTITTGKGIIEDSSLADSDISCVSDYIRVMPNTTYYLTTRNDDGNRRVGFYDQYKNNLQASTAAKGSRAFTTPANCAYCRVSVATRYASETKLELGSSATDKTYTIALGDTIYGGTVDFDSGVMTVTNGKKALNAFSSWGYDQSHHYMFATASDAKTPISNDVKANINSDSYNTETANIIINESVDYGIALSSAGYLIVSDARYTDATTYLTDMGSSELCYELATPFTVQLTPQQIQLLKGTNTLTASTGDISVTVNGVSGSIGAVQEQANDHEERIEAVESGVARLVCTEIVYDDSASLFTLPSGVPKPKDGTQIMVCGRNRSTGAIYALWFDNSASGFKIGKILDGNAPADGISISVQYIA